MVSRSPSSPLIKGIDGIARRSLNKYNYSTLNGKQIRNTITRIEQKLKKTYRKRLFGNYVKWKNKATNNKKMGN